MGMGRKWKRAMEAECGGDGNGDRTSAKGTSGRKGREDLPPVRVPEWKELVDRAEAALDDEGEAKMEKRRRAAEKRIRRMEERGIREVVDVESLRKGLCAYFADVTGGGRMRGFRRVIADFGVNVGDYFGGAEDRYADLKLVHEYIRGLMVKMAKDDAEETVTLAQEAQRRLITEDGCGLNQRAVEVSLKATMRDVYGDGEDRKGEEKKPVIYSLPGLTVNMIMSPREIAAKKLDGSKLVSEVIDV